MYLVDTSVWLDFFRGRASKAVARFEEILEYNLPFGITGLIFQEVLQGADSEEDFSRLSVYLGTQKFYHLHNQLDSFRKAGHIYFRCRRQGVTIRGSADCLVAQVAIEHGLVLLHNDKDFLNMGRVIHELKLA